MKSIIIVFVLLVLMYIAQGLRIRARSQSRGSLSRARLSRKEPNEHLGDLHDIHFHGGAHLGRQAYGNEIAFQPGQYHHEGQHGQELLGHELTHVVQQRPRRQQLRYQD
jgi:flagellar biosynthesis/type III secretory pathway M-ring protein FliF/YscJ